MFKKFLMVLKYNLTHYKINKYIENLEKSWAALETNMAVVFHKFKNNVANIILVFIFL